MKIVFELVTGKDVLSRLATAHTRVAGALKGGVRKAAFLVERTAKRIVYLGHAAGHLEGDRGGLRRSITTEIQPGGMSAAIGPNVVYAAIHEFGGVITPKTAPALRFQIKRNVGGRRIGGPWVTVQQVTIPPRPYMHPALEMEQSNMAEVLQNALYEAIL